MSRIPIVHRSLRSQLCFSPAATALLSAAAAKRSLPCESDGSCHWITAEYAKSSKAALREGAEPCMVPWYSHSARRLISRALFHSSHLVDPLAVASEVKRARCGHSGLFFIDEELCDALLDFSKVWNIKGGFWINRAHPCLMDEYLQLRPNAPYIEVSATVWVVDAEHVKLLDPELVAAADKSRDAPPGVNALAPQLRVSDESSLKWHVVPHGSVDTVDVRNPPARWLALEQVSKLESQGRARVDPAAVSGVLELERRKLHNADQLVVPGRLALIREKETGPFTWPLFR